MCAKLILVRYTRSQKYSNRTLKQRKTNTILIRRKAAEFLRGTHHVSAAQFTLLTLKWDKNCALEWLFLPLHRPHKAPIQSSPVFSPKIYFQEPRKPWWLTNLPNWEIFKGIETQLRPNQSTQADLVVFPRLDRVPLSTLKVIWTVKRVWITQLISTLKTKWKSRDQLIC